VTYFAGFSSGCDLLQSKNRIEHMFDKMRIPHSEKECKRKRLPISGSNFWTKNSLIILIP